MALAKVGFFFVFVVFRCASLRVVAWRWRCASSEVNKKRKGKERWRWQP